jgi:hypothetical protein
MASTPTYQSNPYADFDPSQWSNPYSNFQNSAIPFPATYAGWPTNALGQPIQAPPGMTLNSSPAQPQAAQQPAQQGASLLNNPGPVGPGGMRGQYVQTNPGGMLPSGENYGSSSPTYIQPQYQFMPAQQAAAAPAPAPAANPAGLTSQQYLQLRANPGYVTTPGATVPQSASSATPGPGMLQQFLANWNPAQSGPGSGFQQAFSKALRGST